MVTVQEIYDAAIDLMDEQNEQTGETKTQDTREYELRSISILNIALSIIYPYSSNYDREEPGRPSLPPLLHDDRKNPDFTQIIDIDDALAWSLLPFYLASMLRAAEDTEFSMRMMSEFNTALAAVKDKSFSDWEEITTPYGLF